MLVESGSVVVLVSLEDGMVEGESKVAGTWLFRSMAKGTVCGLRRNEKWCTAIRGKVAPPGTRTLTRR